MTPAIETRGLSKHYGAIAGLQDLSLTIERGEVFGFLGPNGAGKTTTIRLLLGLIGPTSGAATVLGHDVVRATADWRGRVGYLPGEFSLWPGLTGRRTLAELAKLTGRPPEWQADLLARLTFAPADLDRRIATYSDGMKQKIGIVQALQCAPELVLLDEPTKGLDPLTQIAFYDLVQELAGRGTTVFFSSHVLPEVERVCSRVAMLRAGRLASVGTVAELQRALPRRVIIAFSADVDAAALGDLGRVLTATPRRVELLIEAARVPALVTRAASLPIVDLLIEAPGLEEVFLERYR